MPQACNGLLVYPIWPLTYADELDLGALAQLVSNAAGAGESRVTRLATSSAGVVFEKGGAA